MNSSYKEKENVACLLCGGKMKYFLTGYDYLYKTTEKKFHVFKCLVCGSERIIPMPTNTELMSFYPSNYYSYNTSSKNKHKKGFFMKIREEMMAVAYRGRTKRDIYYMLAILVKPFFHGLPLKYIGNRKFLDVGCGDAYNVNLMSRYGWSATGFEIGNKKIDGNIYYNTDLSNVDFDGEKFDCIRVWHVLEHVPNPNEFIKKLSSVLADGGEILIGIPNVASLYATFFGKYWYNRDLPRHVINYNPVSINKLFGRYGMKISRLSYSAAGGFLGSIQHIVNGFFKLKLNLIGNTFLFCIFFPIDILSNFLKIGDCISVVIEKDNRSQNSSIFKN